MKAIHPQSASVNTEQDPVLSNHSYTDISSSSHHSRSPRPFVLIAIVVFCFLGLLAFGLLYFQNQRPKAISHIPIPTPSIASFPKSLIVGTDPTLQPMEYTENGNVIGYDIDLANALAKELGTKVEFKNIVFDDLFIALEEKKIDYIISAVTITPERQKVYEFSDPYLNAGQVIITRRVDATIKSTADLKGKKIAVQKGTTNEAEARKYTSENFVISYPDFEQATNALVGGTVDAVFTDLPNSKGITLSNPTLKIASDPFTNEFYGIVLRKGDPSVTRINDALESLRIKGILTQLKQKWLD